jgi:hypothetical protein
MSVQIGKIDVVAEEDMYKRCGQMTKTELWLEPTERRVVVSQYHDSGATPEGEWHKRQLAWLLDGSTEYGHSEIEAPDDESLREFLEGEEGQALLDRICDGHDINWDGNNIVGSLDDDAQAAAQELMGAINNLPRSEIVTWMVDDWLGNLSDGAN